jgi:hypothetical protein
VSETSIIISLISHTNVGKTTLARTLLRRDVGEVLDQAHVTDASEAFTLIEKDGDRLELWDTPGFGDTARLMRRLREQTDPISWFLKQQWDRVADRPLWCSQQGMINMREQADVVLYLVGAAENPEDAGYVPLELDILTWIDRPAVLILNQVGRPAADHRVSASLEDRWRVFAEPWPVVKDVLPLDAFTRCWTEETRVLERIAPLLEGGKQRTMKRLTEAWNERNLDVFHAACTHIGRYLTRAALDLEVATAKDGSEPGERGTARLMADALKWSTVDKKRAMAGLNQRLDAATVALMEAMITEHGLEGGSAAHIEESLRDFEVKGRLPLNERSGAVAGAILSGALGGLIADVSIGFLSFGGGMVAGGILGALGGSALAKGYRLVGGMREPSVRWSPQFLSRLAEEVVLRYLAVAHYGRGRGEYRDAQARPDWRASVEDALGRHRSKLEKCWTQAERSGSAAEEQLVKDLTRIVHDAAKTVLRSAYPYARKLLS